MRSLYFGLHCKCLIRNVSDLHQSLYGKVPDSELASDAQTLNQTFYAAWEPDQPDFQSLLAVNTDIFSQFNTSLAYNPFTQVT